MPVFGMNCMIEQMDHFLKNFHFEGFWVYPIVLSGKLETSFRFGTRCYENHILQEMHVSGGMLINSDKISPKRKMCLRRHKAFVRICLLSCPLLVWVSWLFSRRYFIINVIQGDWLLAKLAQNCPKKKEFLGVKSWTEECSTADLVSTVSLFILCPSCSPFLEFFIRQVF